MPSNLDRATIIRPDFQLAKNITELGVLEFANWMLESSEDIEQEPIRLPAIQRTALWNPERIVNLWDSLLRGLPIGMFYLIRPISGNYSRPLPGATGESALTIPSSRTGYELLDGQQRALAVLLGRRNPKAEGRCLWVDIGKTDNDLLLCLRLTSRSQPFGYDERGGKLHLYQRQQARSDFDAGEGKVKEPTANHELFDAMLNKENQSRPPRPFKSVLAAPLHEIINAWTESAGDLARFKSLSQAIFGKPVADVSQFGVLVGALENLTTGRIGLLLVRRPKEADTDWLLRLFQRIGAGGVPLTDAERLYSIYKHHEPFVHDVVTQIEKRIGRIMSPVDIAGTALRIANARSPSKGYDTPSVVALAKEMRQSESLFTHELHKLIPSEMTQHWIVDQAPAETDCELSKAFDSLVQIVGYDQDNLCGLPKAMLVELPRDLIQVLVYWIVLVGPSNIQNDLGSPNIRGEIIRFILFWRLCSLDDRGMGLQSFTFLASRSSNMAFPGQDLYRLLTGTLVGEAESIEQSRYSIQMINPTRLRSYAPVSNSDTWLEWTERFEKLESSDTTAKELYRYWWDSGRKILIWLQREYIAVEFSNYDPSSERDDDKPFELDHIQPQSYFTHVAIGAADRLNNFRRNRHVLRDGIGNLRWFDASKNSGFGDCNVVVKLDLNCERGPDRWNSSGFDGDDLSVRQTWIDACVSEKKNWTASNMRAFQNAVEERTLWLYEQFWSQANFSEWFLHSV